MITVILKPYAPYPQGSYQVVNYPGAYYWIPLLNKWVDKDLFRK